MYAVTFLLFNLVIRAAWLWKTWPYHCHFIVLNSKILVVTVNFNYSFQSFNKLYLAILW